MNFFIFINLATVLLTTSFGISVGIKKFKEYPTISVLSIIGFGLFFLHRLGFQGMRAYEWGIYFPGVDIFYRFMSIFVFFGEPWMKWVAWLVILFAVLGWRFSKDSKIGLPILLAGMAVLLDIIAGFIVSRLYIDTVVREIIVFYMSAQEVISTGLILTAIFAYRDEREESQQWKPKSTEYNHVFLLKNPSNVNLPDSCPCCCRKATNLISIKEYKFEEPPVYAYFYGFIGFFPMLFSFWMGAKKALAVKTCNRCFIADKTFKILHLYLSLGSVALIFALMSMVSTPSRPLIKQGVGMTLLVFSPLIIGFFLAHIAFVWNFRFQGVKFVKDNASAGMLFKSCNQHWVEALIARNPENSQQCDVI